MEDTAVAIDTLWVRLQEMEDEKRFGGQAYPEGMCSFPFRLPGQGFFPGGDGLWREDCQLDQVSSGTLQPGGIIFLGNDFGTLNRYRRLQSRGFENPPTWRHLRKRIRRAGLPENRTFFTNAIMGLRSAKQAKALDKRIWQSIPMFAGFCREFLVYQVEVLRPRLLVILGPHARLSHEALSPLPRGVDGMPSKVGIGRHTTSVHCSSHPYGDFNFNEARKEGDAVALRSAWERSAALESRAVRGDETVRSA